MAIRIERVEEGSEAAVLGLAGGDELLSVDGNELNDTLDYDFYTDSKSFHLKARVADGIREWDVRREERGPFGCDFSTYLGDQKHSCSNHCMFCFIDQLPPGRKPIETYAVTSAYYPRLYAFIRKQVDAGRQVYIVCPMVSENDELPDERKAVTEYAQKLQTEIFPDLKVAYVHGKMKAREKDAVMSAFAAGESHILVSTTVIEVGVDVPNASLMVVENAERFGLSQLHQLRGRVGRGQHQSYCVLVSDNKNDETRQRLKAMTKTADGFKIAEEDLRLRGPGDFFGLRQHGLPGLQVADLGCDTRLLAEAQSAADGLLAEDPALTHHPATAERVRKLFQQSENSLN